MRTPTFDALKPGSLKTLLAVAALCAGSLLHAAPTVSLAAPANNAVYAAPVTITLTASASGGEVNTPVTQVEFYAGDTLIGTDTSSPYSVSWTPAAGIYSLTAKATDSAGAVAVSAARTITVNAGNTPPTVSLAAPANNAVYAAPVTITVTASANGGEVNTPITQVEFFAGDTLIGSDTASPYSVTWTPAAGTYSLTAKATDSAGAVTTSAARTITVNASNTPPTVNLTAPANNAVYAAPVTITLTASASGGEVNTPITQVEFYAGDTLIGTDTASPYSVSWTPVAGTYSLTAQATDSAGASTTSAARTITVNVSNTPPKVSLTAPANNAVYAAPVTITLTASASGGEVNTPITQVAFYAGTTLIGTDTASPYSVTWTPSAGIYSLAAKATDNTGAATVSAARSITVNASNTPPTVSLTAPANNAIYMAPATLTVTASASGVEVNTPITQVEFYAGSALIGTATASPYSVSWPNVGAGIYSLTAKATDSGGASTTSAARTITVNASNTPPKVSLTAPANNAVYAAPVTITLTASASGGEVNTPITQVAFYAGTTLIGTDTASPYSVTWTPSAGIYSLTAQATDSACQQRM